MSIAPWQGRGYLHAQVISIGQALDVHEQQCRGGQVFFLCGMVELPKTVECVANKCSPGSLPV